MTKDNKLFIILGNQLFDPIFLKKLKCTDVYIAEDFGLCTYELHHKLKLYLFLVAMREYKDELISAGINVHYKEIDDCSPDISYTDKLSAFLKTKPFDELNFFEIEDKPFEKKVNQFIKKNKIVSRIHQSPMFLFSRQELIELQGDKETYRMSSFYKQARLKLDLLVDPEGKPEGGKWSFDEENRKKIPKNSPLPAQMVYEHSKYHDEIEKIVENNFSNHPGKLHNFWFPVTRKQAKRHLQSFLKNRFDNFGVYEDAMVQGENFLFHSSLSSSLNIGLITPKQVIKEIEKLTKSQRIPLNSLEGFVRQVIGWREFIRGIYQQKSEYQITKNYWNHTKKLGSSWYEGKTGILPLDDCIKSAINDGYSHHIPRLMVISNLMNMCEVDPEEIYKWFMEMYIDSSDWVMIPNVYGMATYSDGGLMSTKPYTCGSNYILKMSNYPKGEWCEVMDGLYWRFIEKHRSFYEKNARMGFITKTLDRMTNERKELIFTKAKNFIEENTI